MHVLASITEALDQHPGHLPFAIEARRDTIVLTYATGQGATFLREPIDGVVLSYHHMKSPGFGISTKGIGDGVKLNYCIAGRLEVSMADGRTLFMSPGDLSVETSTAWKFSFPCGFYEGIELFLHRSSLDSPPPFFEECGIDLKRLVSRLGNDRMRNWTRTADERTARLFTELLPKAGDCEQARLRLTCALLLLALADFGVPCRESDSAIFSKRQVSIAKQAESLLTDDLSRRRSIADVAAQLGVKPTTLKEYFKGVYGKCISDYLLDARMSRADEMLREQDMPVADVARSLGYSHVGKFCEAFKHRFGATPLKYRQQSRNPSCGPLD